MYGIFAMLFGLSFFIMNDNQQQKGRSFSGRYWFSHHPRGPLEGLWRKLTWI